MRFLVVDSGAIIHKQRVDELGDRLYTTSAVLREIRDRSSRFHLETLPANITERVPSAAHLRAVREFATKTGDAAFLSATDLSVIALAYGLLVENGATFNIKPVSKICDTAVAKSANLSWAPIASKGDDDDETGWVTPDNFSSFSQSTVYTSSLVPNTPDLKENNVPVIPVAVMTGDYSIQNVCLQIGIEVLSYEKMRIRQLRQWGLVCMACWTIIRDTQKAFCSSCGNDALRKTAIVTEESGQVAIAGNIPRRPMRRGMSYTAPKFRGGREPNRPIYTEDEVFIGGRDRELLKKQKEYEKELEARLCLGDDGNFSSRGMSGGRVAGGAPRITSGYNLTRRSARR